MGGIGSGASREHVTTATIVRQALERNDRNVPRNLGILQDMADDPKTREVIRVECATYLINRSQGLPKSSLDVKVSQQLVLSLEDRALIAQVILEERQLLGMPMLSLEAPQATPSHDSPASDSIPLPAPEAPPVSTEERIQASYTPAITDPEAAALFTDTILRTKELYHPEEGSGLGKEEREIK